MEAVGKPNSAADSGRPLGGAYAALSVVEIFDRHVKASPDALAVVWHGHEWSYRELSLKSERLARQLLALGAGPNQLIGIYMSCAPATLVAIIGVLKSGAAYVPLDPTYPVDRIQFMIGDSGCRLLIASTAQPLPFEFANRLVLLDHEGWASERDAGSFTTMSSPENLAYVIYTSGSTGKPKGVMIRHDSLLAYVSWAERTYLTAEQRGFALCTSLAFDLTVTSIFVPLISGRHIRVFQGADNAEVFAYVMADPKVDVLKVTPSHLQLIAGLDCTRSRAKVLIVGGEDLLASVAEAIRTRLPERPRIYNEYGPTEATVGCMVQLHQQGVLVGSVPIGRPAANTRLYILDRFLELVPIGVPGELCIAGRCLAAGYWGQPELTDEKFIRNPRVPGERIYRTGDRVRWRADGIMEYLGRIDQQVKIRGHRIELGEIECALLECTFVKDAAVVVIQTAHLKELCAFYVERETVTKQQLRLHLGAKLPAYMIPGHFECVSELPLNQNGKLDRGRLQQIVIARPQVQPQGSSPKTPLERRIGKIWDDVLGVVSFPESNFFELGGNSITATLVLARIRTDYGIKIPLRLFFTTPVLSEFCRRVSDIAVADDAGHLSNRKRQLETEDGCDAILTEFRKTSADGAVARYGPDPLGATAGPLSSMQRRLWLLDSLSAGTVNYNIIGLLRISGQLNPDQLRDALSAVTHRHGILRSRIIVRNSEPWQEQLPIEELFTLTIRPFINEEDVWRVVGSEQRFAFNLATGPLFRATLLREASNLHYLVINTHHIATDGWSHPILAEDLRLAFELTASEPSSRVNTLPVTYADYSAWEQANRQTEEYRGHLNYWVETLTGYDGYLNLPSDVRKMPKQTYAAGSLTVAVPSTVKTALTEVCRSSNASLFTGLLCTLAMVLNRLLGVDDLVIGTVVANRRAAGTDRLVGFFANTLPLRIECRRHVTFREWVSATGASLIQALEHQEVPLDEIVDAIKLPRKEGMMPLIQVALIFQNTPNLPNILGGLTIEYVPIAPTEARFDLLFEFTDIRGQMQCMVTYNSDHYVEKYIKMFTSRFIYLLQNVAESPDRPIQEYSLEPQIPEDGEDSQTRDSRPNVLTDFLRQHFN